MTEVLLAALAFFVFILFFAFGMPWIIWGLESMNQGKLNGLYDRYLDIVWRHTHGRNK